MADLLVPVAFVKEEEEQEEEAEVKHSRGSASVTTYGALASLTFVDAYSTSVSMRSLGWGILDVSSRDSLKQAVSDL